jgi:hypothetical protein
MRTYLKTQNAVLSAPGLTGAAMTYPKTIPQLAAAGHTFLLFAFPCFLRTVTHTHNGGDDDKMETKSGWREGIPLASELV